MSDITADYNGPIDWRENFAALVQYRYADREAPGAWPLESWEPERGEIPVAAFPRGWRCGDILPGCYRGARGRLKGDGNVDNDRLAPGAARAAVGGATLGPSGRA